MTTIAVALGRGPGTEATRSVARKAAELWLARKVDFVLLSGRWSVLDTQTHSTTEAADMLEVALAMGVPLERIMLDDWSRDTVSNMEGTRRALLKRGIEHGQLVFVTIPHAEKRALYLACKVLGNRFTASSVASGYSFDEFAGEEAKMVKDERKFLLVTRASLVFAPSGNLRAIQWFLHLWHPGYQHRKVPDPIQLTA